MYGGDERERSEWNGQKERRYVKGRSGRDMKGTEERKRHEGTKMERSDVPFRLKFLYVPKCRSERTAHHDIPSKRVPFSTDICVGIRNLTLRLNCV